VVISQPFWPAYLTAERIAKAKNLKLAITAGIGSDHVALEAAIKNGVTVAEVTYSNSISVSEHVVMMILSLVRNYIPSYQWVINGGWNIADCVSRSYDLEAMEVGTVAAGRIGLAVLQRLISTSSFATRIGIGRKNASGHSRHAGRGACASFGGALRRPSGLRPSSFVIWNTPVEVQFILAGVSSIRAAPQRPPAFLPFLPQRADPERGVRPLVTNGYLEVGVAAEIIQAKLHPLSS